MNRRSQGRVRRLLIMGILSLVLGFVFACTNYKDFERRVLVSRTNALKGEQLVQFAACTYCHGMDLQGKIEDGYAAPNLTLLQNVSDEALLAYMRGNTILGEEDRSSSMHSGYEWMSDNDLFAIIGYLRRLAPEGEFVESAGGGILGPSFEGEVKGIVPDVEESIEATGKYLVDHVARCGFCHSSEEYLDGGELEWLGDIKTPALRNPETLGVKGLSHDRQKAKLIRYLIEPEHGNCPSYRSGSDEQIGAIAEFLVKLWHE